jgi:hypothetical protein
MCVWSCCHAAFPLPPYRATLRLPPRLAGVASAADPSTDAGWSVAAHARHAVSPSAHARLDDPTSAEVGTWALSRLPLPHLSSPVRLIVGVAASKPVGRGRHHQINRALEFAA